MTTKSKLLKVFSFIGSIMLLIVFTFLTYGIGFSNGKYETVVAERLHKNPSTVQPFLFLTLDDLPPKKEVIN